MLFLLLQPLCCIYLLINFHWEITGIIANHYLHRSNQPHPLVPAATCISASTSYATSILFWSPSCKLPRDAPPQVVVRCEFATSIDKYLYHHILYTNDSAHFLAALPLWTPLSYSDHPASPLLQFFDGTICHTADYHSCAQNQPGEPSIKISHNYRFSIFHPGMTTGRYFTVKPGIFQVMQVKNIGL